MANSFINIFLENLQPIEYKAINQYIRSNIFNARESKTLEVFEQLSKEKSVSYLERNKKDEKIRLRDKLILSTLRELKKNFFEYNPQNKTLAKLVQRLTAKKTSASWEHFTPELIPFHEWLLRKGNKKHLNNL
jgi:hypothetical protein